MGAMVAAVGGEKVFTLLVRDMTPSILQFTMAVLEVLVNTEVSYFILEKKC